MDPALVACMLDGFAYGHAAVCLCDEEDNVRYVNPAFRAAFFPNAPHVPFEFTAALEASIRAGMGIRLETMPLDEFVPRVRQRRKSGPARYDFAVDMVDGTWWWVNDHRLPDGWMLIVATDISSLKAEEFRLRAAHSAAIKETQVDALTGMRSRKYGLVQFELDLKRHLDDGIAFTVAILDIDHFKRINDTFGHIIGDEVLKHFAQTLAGRLSTLDHVTRLGGEEFLVTMSSTPEAMGVARLERLIRSITPLKRGPNQIDLKYSFSAGVTLTRASDTVSSLLTRADAALYQAKHSGRGKVCISGAANTDAA